MPDLGYYKMRALIVDDFENFRGTLSKMLMDIGLGNVDAAHTGEEALRYAKARKYDLILCDHNLGKGKSGQQVLEELRVTQNHCSDSLFILVSAESSKSIIMAAYDYEPDAYLAKPITPKALEQRISRLFEQRIELKDIYAAHKQQDSAQAVELSKRYIASNGRYANVCQKLLGQLYLKENNLAAAEGLYRSVLDNRELEWAQLGMAKTKIQQGDMLGAQQWLENVLQTNALCLKAYDLLADIYRSQGNFEALQEILQKATDLSPLSILRQQSLGDVAQQNSDVVIAANALKRAVKLGENSCFDKPEVHTQFAQSAIDLFAIDKELAKPILRDALKCVSDLEERFGKSQTQRAISYFLESQLHYCSGEERKAMDALGIAQAALVDSKGEGNILSAEIESVRSLKLVGKEAEAQAQLAELLQKYAKNEDQLQKLDVLLDEPRSEKNKLMVAEINKKGIALYNAKDFINGANAFNTAIQKLPNHIGLRLNHAQALLDALKLQFSEELDQKVSKAFEKIGTIIASSHGQFQRYRQLHDTYLRLAKAREHEKNKAVRG